MNDCRMNRSRTWVLLASALAALPLHAVRAEESLARVTLTLEVEGSESARAAGGDWGKGKISERYHVVTTVKTDGVLSSVNPKDPEYHEKALAQANRDRARIRAAQERVAAAGAAPPAPDADEAAALLAEMQAAIAACADEACRQSVGLNYATRPGFAAAMAVLAQPEYACKQFAGGDAAREAQCLQSYGITPGAAEADESFDPDAEEAPPDERYLMYIGWIGCPTEISIRVDNRLEGAYADVAGMIPYEVTEAADWSGTETDRNSLCVSYTTVLDTKGDMIYTDGAGLPAVRGVSTYREPGRRPDERSESELAALPGVVGRFVFDTLRAAPVAGTKRTTLALDRPYLARPPISEYEGEVHVALTWKFEPL